MKLAFCILIVSVLLESFSFKTMAHPAVFFPGSFMKDPGPDKNEDQVTLEEKAKILLFRLHEIKVMDKSKLPLFERRGLRKEVRSIKRQFRGIYRGCYFSVGSMLMTELLLIF